MTITTTVPASGNFYYAAAPTGADAQDTEPSIPEQLREPFNQAQAFCRKAKGAYRRALNIIFDELEGIQDDLAARKIDPEAALLLSDAYLGKLDEVTGNVSGLLKDTAGDLQAAGLPIGDCDQQLIKPQSRGLIPPGGMR